MSFPAIAAAVAALLVWVAWPHVALITDSVSLRTATAAIMTMDATMLGFLVAAGALIFAVAQTSVLRNLYRTGHVPRLLAALFLNAGLFFVSLCAALIGMLVEPLVVDVVRVLVALNAAALVGLLPVAHSMWHLLINAGPSDGPLEFK